jgi:hypothetical protein
LRPIADVRGSVIAADAPCSRLLTPVIALALASALGNQLFARPGQLLPLLIVDFLEGQCHGLRQPSADVLEMIARSSTDDLVPRQGNRLQDAHSQHNAILSFHARRDR